MLAVLAPIVAAAEAPLAVLADGTQVRGGGRGGGCQLAARLARWRRGGGPCPRPSWSAGASAPKRSGPLAILLADGGLVAAESVSVQQRETRDRRRDVWRPGRPAGIAGRRGLSRLGRPRNATTPWPIESCRRPAAPIVCCCSTATNCPGGSADMADDVVHFETDLGPVKAAADRVSGDHLQPGRTAARRPKRIGCGRGSG